MPIIINGNNTPTAGGVGYGNGTELAFTTAGTAGNFLVSAGAGAPAWTSAGSVAVTSLSFGTTGLTPATPTSGAVVVAGVLSAANGGTGLSALGTGVATALGVNVGTAGAFVVNGGALGTPSSGVLSACTGLPISTGVSGLGANIATFLSTPSSANLAVAVTDETGSGSLVFGTSPTLATPTITTSATVPLLIGGTGTTSTLTLRSTSGVGTTGADIIFQTGNNGATEAMRVLNSGNVGIGTASPTAKLDVRGSMYVIGAAGTRVTDTDTGNGFEVVPSTTNNVLSYNRTTAAYLPIRWRAGIQSWEVDNTERMRIDSSGNVGIGTASPTSPLTVYAGNNQATIKVTNGPSANNVGITLESLGGNVVLNNGNGPLEISTGGSIRAVLTTAGNLGIGTTSLLANTRVHIAQNSDANYSTSFTPGTTKAQLVLRDLSDTGTYTTPFSALTFVAGSSGAGSSYIAGAREGAGTSFMAFGTGTASNATERMRITSAGLVGIGTTSPATKLDVRGQIASQGWLNLWNSNNVGTMTSTTDVRPAVTFGTTDTAQGFFFGPIVSDTLTNSSMGLYTWQGDKWLMTWRASDGYVGIGTTSPTAKLTVTAAAAAAVLTNTASGGAFQSVMSLRSTSPTIGAAIQFYDGTNDGYISWYNQNLLFAGTGGVERMRIDSSGNVGIGVTPVAYGANARVLHIDGGANASEIRLTNNTTGTSASNGGLIQQAGNDLYIWNVENSFLSFGTNNTEKARVTAGGNFKIGGTAERATTTGTNHLDIYNGTAPVGTLTNGISIYSSSGEAYVMDAAGNATLFSPHDATTNEWIFKSKHTPTGKVLKIDVEKMLRFINDHFGLDMVHEFTE